MKKLLTISLLMLLCISIKAQDVVIVGYGLSTPNGDVPILYKSNCCPVRCPKINVDKKTKKTTVAWDDMEMAYMTDKCEVTAPIATDFDKIFPDKIHGLPREYVLLYWMLSEENNETVLHCYFTMPADEVTNLWLACDETAIVDMETGVQYRAKRTDPDCFRKHFTVKAPVGTALDFKIYFPKLPSTTHEIGIFGVPLWNLRGTKVRIFGSGHLEYTNNQYDPVPDIKAPHLVQEEQNYNKDNHKTWAVYDQPHLIKPVDEGKMALWRTPEATYLAVAHEQNWNREYYGHHPETVLMDNRGHKYKLKSIKGLPIGNIFWIEGNSGDYIVFLLEFEPIPPSVSTITYIEPEGEKFDMVFASWAGEIKPNLNVNELRKNQELFKYQERKVVKE